MELGQSENGDSEIDGEPGEDTSTLLDLKDESNTGTEPEEIDGADANLKDDFIISLQEHSCWV